MHHLAALCKQFVLEFPETQCVIYIANCNTFFCVKAPLDFTNLFLFFFLLFFFFLFLDKQTLKARGALKGRKKKSDSVRAGGQIQISLSAQVDKFAGISRCSPRISCSLGECWCTRCICLLICCSSRGMFWLAQSWSKIALLIAVLLPCGSPSGCSKVGKENWWRFRNGRGGELQ